MTPSFSPTAAAIEGFHILRRHWSAVVVWVLVYLATYAALMALGWFWVGKDVFDVLTDGALATQDTGAVLSQAQAFILRSLPFLALFFLVTTLMDGAIQNAVVRCVLGLKGGIARLKLGGDEVRFVGLVLLLLLITFAALAAMIFVGALIGLSRGADADGAAALPVYGVIGLLLIPVCLWVLIRLSFVGVLVVAEKAISLGRSWRVSRGHFWRLFGMWLIVIVIVIATGMLDSAVSQLAVSPFQSRMADLGETPSAADLLAAMTPLLPLIIPAVLVSSITQVVARVISVSAAARAYRDITATPAAEAEGGA